tara:strand:+ start:145 stop:516 length:372 start_codon:yes stop_codon:yes gene_type:complete
MSDLKLCQGTKCHQYYTKDRIKGQQGSKTNQTRRRSNFYYGGGNFCSYRCQEDWFNDFGDKAIDYFGRTTEAKHLTEKNAWQKTYDWSSNNETQYIYRNAITEEQHSITEQQFNDSNYTLNTT